MKGCDHAMARWSRFGISSARGLRIWCRLSIPLYLRLVFNEPEILDGRRSLFGSKKRTSWRRHHPSSRRRHQQLRRLAPFRLRVCYRGTYNYAGAINVRVTPPSLSSATNPVAWPAISGFRAPMMATTMTMMPWGPRNTNLVLCAGWSTTPPPVIPEFIARQFMYSPSVTEVHASDCNKSVRMTILASLSFNFGIFIYWVLLFQKVPFFCVFQLLSSHLAHEFSFCVFLFNFFII